MATEHNEISLFDIYEFFRDGWKTILGFSAIGLLIGQLVMFILPEKFQASALIEPGSVVFKASMSKQSIESPVVLAEKMRQPTYYGIKTLQECRLTNTDNPAQTLVSRLNPGVVRNSAYVSISFLADSPSVASACLESVLNDVIANQAPLAKPFINVLQVEVANAEQELQSAITERDQQRLNNKEKLSVAQSKLSTARSFVEKFSKDTLAFNFDDPQFSASALLVSTLIEQQNEIKDLELEINELEMKISANLTDKDQAVRKITNMVNELKNLLIPPNTKDASFAAPIYAPDQKVRLDYPVVIAVSLLAGFCMGVLILLAMRLKNNIRLSAGVSSNRQS